MAVRFLPPPGEPKPGVGVDRPDLAEVIELRGLLRQRAWGTSTSSAADATEAANTTDAADTTDAAGAAGIEGVPDGEYARDENDAEYAEGFRRVHGAPHPAASGSEFETPGESDTAGDSDQAAEPDVAPPVQLRAVLSLVTSSPTESDTEAAPESEQVTAPPASLGAQPASLSSLVPASSLLPGADAGSGSGSDADADADLDEAAPDAARIAYEDGVRLLARRARSSGELREELLRLEHAAGDVDILIDEFRDSHYLDDVGLARTVTEKLRTGKRASRSQIRVKLRDRRLPDAIIDEVLGELDDDEEYSLLREAAVARAGKLGGLDRQVAERRLLGFLARRGWSGEPATRAVKAALDGSASGRSGGVRFR